jgi:hypothetical protein
MMDTISNIHIIHYFSISISMEREKLLNLYKNESPFVQVISIFHI